MKDRKIKEIVKSTPLTIIRGGGYNNEYSPKANLNTLACFSDIPIIYKYEKKFQNQKNAEGGLRRK